MRRHNHLMWTAALLSLLSQKALAASVRYEHIAVTSMTAAGYADVWTACGSADLSCKVSLSYAGDLNVVFPRVDKTEKTLESDVAIAREIAVTKWRFLGVTSDFVRRTERDFVRFPEPLQFLIMGVRVDGTVQIYKKYVNWIDGDKATVTHSWRVDMRGFGLIKDFASAAAEDYTFELRRKGGTRTVASLCARIAGHKHCQDLVSNASDFWGEVHDGENDDKRFPKDPNAHYSVTKKTYAYKHQDANEFLDIVSHYAKDSFISRVIKDTRESSIPQPKAFNARDRYLMNLVSMCIDAIPLPVWMTNAPKSMLNAKDIASDKTQVLSRTDMAKLGSYPGWLAFAKYHINFLLSYVDPGAPTSPAILDASGWQVLHEQLEILLTSPRFEDLPIFPGEIDRRPAATLLYHWFVYIGIYAELDEIGNLQAQPKSIEFKNKGDKEAWKEILQFNMAHMVPAANGSFTHTVAPHKRILLGTVLNGAELQLLDRWVAMAYGNQQLKTIDSLLPSLTSQNAYASMIFWLLMHDAFANADLHQYTPIYNSKASATAGYFTEIAAYVESVKPVFEVEPDLVGCGESNEFHWHNFTIDRKQPIVTIRAVEKAFRACDVAAQKLAKLPLAGVFKRGRGWLLYYRHLLE